MPESPYPAGSPEHYGRGRPAVVGVRLTGPPEVVDAALASLAASHGDAWQPSTRKPSRYSGAEVVQYGTLLVTGSGA